MKTLIKNAKVFLSSGFSRNNILIDGDIIVYIGKEVVEADKVIDAYDKIILPGLINSHIHFGECFIRGYKGKLTTNEYISYAEELNMRNKNLMEKMRVVSTDISILESISYGTTTMVGIRGFETAIKSRGRFYFGYPFMKSNKLKSYLENAFYNLNKLIENKKDENYYIFIHSLLWVDEDILKSVSEYFNDNKNIFLAMHIEETKEEKDKVKFKYGLTPIKLMEKYNLLNERTLLVHACYIDNEDIKIIKKYNSSVCVCPISNLKLKNKIAPIKKLIENNINIVIGTDGGATNDSFSLLEELKVLALITDIDVYTLFNMITCNPSKFFRENIGEIKVGNNADLIFFSNDTTLYRDDSILENIIFRGQVKVSNIIINGKFVVANYKNLYLNENYVNSEKEKLLKEIK